MNESFCFLLLCANGCNVNVLFVTKGQIEEKIETGPDFVLLIKVTELLVDNHQFFSQKLCCHA